MCGPSRARGIAGAWRAGSPPISGNRRHPWNLTAQEAGHEPEVIRSYGYAALPAFLNATPGRREVKRLTGNYWVPALVTDDGTVVQGSHEIADWAKTHPAAAAAVS